jgi:hypothetical protein
LTGDRCVFRSGGDRVATWISQRAVLAVESSRREFTPQPHKFTVGSTSWRHRD